MTSLKDIQAQFVQAVLDKQKTDIEQEIQDGDISAQGVMDVYRNNSFGAATNALSLTYPVVQQLVGERFFNAAASIYIGQTPFTSNNLDEYGEEFASFLGNFPPAQSLPYLADVASLEWYHHLSSLADQSASFDASAFGSVPEKRYFDLTFTFQASCFLLSSTFPIHHIWEMHQQGAEEGSIDLQEGGVQLMIIRRGRKVDIELLTPSEYVFLSALQEGKRFYDAYEAAVSLEEEFDLEFYLKKHIVNGTFSMFSLLSGS